MQTIKSLIKISAKFLSIWLVSFVLVNLFTCGKNTVRYRDMGYTMHEATHKVLVDGLLLATVIAVVIFIVIYIRNGDKSRMEREETLTDNNKDNVINISDGAETDQALSKESNSFKSQKYEPAFIISATAIIVLVLSCIALIIIGLLAKNTTELSGNLPSNPIGKSINIEKKTPFTASTLIDTNTAAKKLDFELLSGNTKSFLFDDPLNFFGTKLRIKYPESMFTKPGDKKRTIVVISILDEDNCEFRCIVNFQPMKIRKGSIQEKKDVLNKENIRQGLSQYGSMFSSFEIIDVQDGVWVATEPASYGEYYCESLKTDKKDRPYSVCRSYWFYYDNGMGFVNFYLDSKHMEKFEIKEKFETYKTVINRMVNSVEIYL